MVVITVGSGFIGPMNGKIAELIIYKRAISEDERNEVEKYLSDKFGIELE